MEPNYIASINVNQGLNKNVARAAAMRAKIWRNKQESADQRGGLDVGEAIEPIEKALNGLTGEN